MGKRIAAYVRVSTDKQGKSGLGFESQRERQLDQSSAADSGGSLRVLAAELTARGFPLRQAKANGWRHASRA